MFLNHTGDAGYRFSHVFHSFRTQRVVGFLNRTLLDSFGSLIGDSQQCLGDCAAARAQKVLKGAVRSAQPLGVERLEAIDERLQEALDGLSNHVGFDLRDDGVGAFDRDSGQAALGFDLAFDEIDAIDHNRLALVGHFQEFVQGHDAEPIVPGGLCPKRIAKNLSQSLCSVVMVTIGELRRDPHQLSSYRSGDFLASVPAGSSEVVVCDPHDVAANRPPETMVFMHETIAMMKAERAEQLEKLRGVLCDDSELLALKKKPESLWEHITLGRASSSDLVVKDPAISSVHAHFPLGVDAHPVSVQDVGSSNGTFVNRKQLQPHALVKLSSGDCIRFGQSIFYYVSGGFLYELLTTGA